VKGLYELEGHGLYAQMTMRSISSRLIASLLRS
jgi:hypothetical protein